MILVNLEPSGAGKICLQKYKGTDTKIEPMVIPKCQRCIGMFIFWKIDTGYTTERIITALHLPPACSRKEAKRGGKWLHKKLSELVPNGIPYYISSCGGILHTTKDEVDYENSLRNFIYPFKRKYPSISQKIFKPRQQTHDMTLSLHEDGAIDMLERYHDTN